MRFLRRHAVQYFSAMSQTFFLKNAWFGMLLLMLLLPFSPTLFAFGFAGSLVGYVFAARVSTPHLLRESGLLPINGFFFGIAMARLFHLTPSLYFFFALGALSLPYVARALFEVLQHWKIGPLVTPYILTLWAVSLCGQEGFSGLSVSAWPLVPRLPIGPIAGLSVEPFLRMIGASTGRLLFFPDPRFGWALLGLVFLFSPRRGLGFLAGTSVAGLCAYLLLNGSSQWQLGALSFSAGLVGLGLAAFPERFSARTILFFCTLSAFLTLAIQAFLGKLDLPILSVPYVATLWLALLSRTPRLNLHWARNRETATVPLIAASSAAAVQKSERRVA